MTPLARLIPLLLVCLVPLAASAARGDSEQPVSIEANKGSIDNRKNVHVFEGGVVLSQGSLAIRCEKLVVTQDGDGFKKGVASGGEGGRASIRQRREGRDDFVEGRASRIEYDARSRKAILVGKAQSAGQHELLDGLALVADVDRFHVSSPGSSADLE